jgi:acyl carrier protein
MKSPIATGELKSEIRAKVIELARSRGIDASHLKDDDVIPQSGALDSAGILELIVWCETRFDVTLDDGDITLDNFGTIDAMAAYLAEK